MINVANFKVHDGILFSDKALAELTALFELLKKILEIFGDLLITRNRSLADHLLAEQKRLGQMTVDFSLAHEDRLVEGICTPKASVTLPGHFGFFEKCWHAYRGNGREHAEDCGCSGRDVDKLICRKRFFPPM